MTFSVWLSWAVVAALALPALFASLLFVVERRMLLWAMLWSPALVFLVVAVVLTADAAHVSDDELYDAADGAAAGFGDTVGVVTGHQVEVAIEDRLGHDVGLDEAPAEATGTTEQHWHYDVTAGAAAVCVSVDTDLYRDPTHDGATSGLHTTTVAVSAGSC